MNKYIPKIYQKSIYTIDYSKLLNRGIKCILFDLDNTLISTDKNDEHIKAKKLIIGLKQKGFEVIIFSNSPRKKVRKYTKYFNIDGYFDVAVGSELEGGERRHKNQVINEVFVRLSEAGLTGDDDITMAKSKAIMIGDRKDDILGAKASGIESMGVRYGFAEEQELEIAGADYIVETVEDIRGKLKTL